MPKAVRIERFRHCRAVGKHERSRLAKLAEVAHPRRALGLPFKWPVNAEHERQTAKDLMDALRAQPPEALDEAASIHRSDLCYVHDARPG